MKSRTVKGILIVGLAVGAVGLASGWLWHHRASLRPELVLTLPAETCSGLQFGPNPRHPWQRQMLTGSDVSDVCRSHGVSDGPLFALKGKQALEFVVTGDCGWHLHGRLEVAEANEGMVYFYRYDERYRSILEQP